jgi:N-ethylmaleimide reductase
MTTTTQLFETYSIDNMSLPNRVVMAPMTRNRADDAGVPVPMMATYYAQRASGGLLITEASQISGQGQGYINTPGIYTEDQTAGWRSVTEAVHAAGGRIFLQLWHVGRISHTSFQPGGGPPLAPSAVRAQTQVFTTYGFEPASQPRAMTIEEIAPIVDQYRHGAAQARAAGFDGVEIHAANGYLIDQFLRDGTNHRTDAYGGSIANRIRFALEVTEAVVKEWAPGRVGIRLSPRGTFNDIRDSDPQALFGYLVDALNAYPLAYLHLLEPLPGHPTLPVQEEVAPMAPELRRRFKGAMILNGGYTHETAEAALANGEADLIAFGVPYLANPDLPERLRQGAPLNPPEQETFYGGDEKGYTDYPVLAEAAVQA